MNVNVNVNVNVLGFENINNELERLDIDYMIHKSGGNLSNGEK